MPGTIDPDQHAFPGPLGGQAGHLLERVFEDGDVVGGSVRTSVTGAEQDRQRFPRPGVSVIDEHTQRVEPVTLLERRFRVLFVRMRRDQGGIHINDQRLLDVGAVVGGTLTRHFPRASPGFGAGSMQRLQHAGAVASEQADQPRDCRVRRHVPVHGRLGPHQSHISEAVTTQGEADRQIGHDLARIVASERFAPRRQRLRQAPGEAGHHRRLREQHAPSLTHHPSSSGVVTGLGIHGGTLHGESASFAWVIGTSTITFSQAGSTFAVQTTKSDPTLMKARG